MWHLLEQINRGPSTWYATLGLADAFFSIPIRRKKRNSSHSLVKGNNIHSQSYPRAMFTLLLSVIKWSGESQPARHLSENPRSICYIDNIMPRGLVEQEVPSMSHALVKHLLYRVWDINLFSQFPSELVEALGLLSHQLLLLSNLASFLSGLIPTALTNKLPALYSPS